jgi:ribosomal protein S18 acetylase RimI-like enzyme
MEPMRDILFDGKIAGSLHRTSGNAYQVADNGNRSEVHCGLLLIQRPEHSGGEITFDDTLVRKDGGFVLPERAGLHPESRRARWEYALRTPMEPRIISYLRTAISRRATEKIGPFLASFDRYSDSPFRNYAIPDDGAIPSSAEVAALVAAYERRGLTPRLEYAPALAPAVEATLVDGGFTVEGRLPLMICTPGSAPDLTVLSGIELILPVTEAEILATLTVQGEAYGASAPPGPEEVTRIRAFLTAGGILLLARDAATGEPAGAGLCDVPGDGVTELAAVGVRVPFRRRGIAGAVTARLTREAFAAGLATVFLMASGEAEERIYTRAGFATTSQMLHISRSPVGR